MHSENDQSSEPKPKRKQKGKVIRVGAEVWNVLRKKRKLGESWDAFFRRAIGIPTLKGESNDRPTFWVLPKAGMIFSSEKEARGMAVVVAVKARRKKAEAPILVKEEI